MMLYECGVRYERMMENGMNKKVTELYLVDACSFAEAEGRIDKGNGTVPIWRLRCGNYQTHQLLRDCGWFVHRRQVVQAKLVFITIDEKSGKEKKTATHFIVSASDINNAHICVVEHMKGSVMDFEIATLDETKIMDIFRYKPNTANG